MTQESLNEASFAVLKRDVGELRSDVTELTAATKELVEAWRAAGKLVLFIKWLAGIATTLGACWAVVSHLMVRR